MDEKLRISVISTDVETSKLQGIARKIFLILTLIGVGAAVFHIFGFSIGGHVMWPRAYYSILIACYLPLIFIGKRHRAGLQEIPWFDWAAIILCILCCIYIFFNTMDIEYKSWEYYTPPLGLIVGFVLCFLILEAARRTGGLLFFGVVTFFFFFPLFAHFMPRIMEGIGFTLKETVSYYVFGSDTLFGLVMDVMGNLLMGFLVFAVALNYSGGGPFFLNLAYSLVGGARGGPAKVAVIGSGFFGSMCGDVMTNVTTTGSITIPAMKKLGYRPEYAGAVEACASTGGVLMPPIMGATAFIMAQILGISYADVAMAAAIPAILFYTSLLIQVDAYSAKMGLRGLPRDQIPSTKKTLKEGWPFLFSLIVLVILIFYLRVVALAPFYTTGILMLTVIVWKWRKLTRQQWLRQLEETGKAISTMIPILLGVGFIIGSLTRTGVASSFSREVIHLAGDNALLLLVMGAFGSFVLGMGMTISACYIFLAMTMAPPLVAAGFDPLAVHLFVMYYSMLSFITPPVALGAAAGSAIAGASFVKTAFTSMRMGFVLFIAPFTFVYTPSLVLRGSLSEAALHIFTFLVGIVFIVGMIEGYIMGLGLLGGIYRPKRLIALITGILLIIPSTYTAVGGAVLGFLLFLPMMVRWVRKVLGRS